MNKDQKVWVEVKCSDRLPENYGMYLVRITDHNGQTHTANSSYNELGFFLANVTHWLQERPLKEVIQELMPSEGEVKPFVKKFMEGDPESFEKNEHGIYLYENAMGTGLNLQVYFEELLEEFIQSKLIDACSSGR